MKIAIMQPYIFPYIGYFHLLHSVDTFVIFDDVNFIKKGWINRNRILIADNPAFFTIPINKLSQNKLIKDLQISNNEQWKPKLLKTIEYNYKKAPNYIETFNLISRIIYFQSDNLSDFIINSIEILKNHLNINSKLIKSSLKYDNSNLKGENRIIDICKNENASIYVNLPGGKNLYNKNNFLINNINLKFINSKNFKYKQFSNIFVPDLSIIDILMFNNVNNAKKIFSAYELTD